MAEILCRTDRNVLSSKMQSSKASEQNFSLLNAVFSAADQKLIIVSGLTEELEARSVFQEKPALKNAWNACQSLGGNGMILHFDSNCALAGFSL